MYTDALLLFIIYYCTHAVTTTSEPSETLQAITARNAENQYNNFCTG